MVKAVWSDFISVLVGLPLYLSKGPLKWDFLDIYLTTFFGVRKFKNTSAMRVIFFLKMFKIESKIWKFKKKKRKSWEKFFPFWENCMWNCCNKLPRLRREYLPSAVNVLTKSPKIFGITNRDISNWIVFTVINKSGKGILDQIWTVFRRVYHVTCGRVFWNGTF